MFPEIDYLDWISGRPESASHDLGSSDLRRPLPDPDGVVPPELADLPAPPEDTDLEAIIADGYDVEPENVLVTAGATHANFLVVAAAINDTDENPNSDGDETAHHDPRVLVEKPGYEPLVATSEGLGATVDRFYRREEDDYALDPSRVSGATTDDTRCIVVTNRHNPSGNRAERETIADASSAAVENDAYLIVDEVYAPFCENADPSVFGGPTGAGLPNTVVTNSLTKFHGFGSVRIGWLVADAEFVSRAQSIMYHVPAVSGPAAALARRALYSDAQLAAESRERILENQELLAEFVAGRDDLTGTATAGCTYGFFEHESADGDEVSEAAWEEGILVVPGRFFDDKERFRLSLGHDGGTVKEGLEVFGSVLDEL
ncbi:pyridoxal phosphate-dependent aminotransferase [Haladaptatus cibarius]|uniref:pyridoxal phosphate-dependent aminotransferase n=1 Tax=Haladaptatus cibarius TaxID=453847 RepID=UPI00067869C7|nr:pyridoxal phosphate-dependent aminotransferase [Haladaptatus cibarius]